MSAFTVAVAGGTGGIGRAIVAELVKEGKHKVLILSRTSSTIQIGTTSLPTFATSYSDIPSITHLLQQHSVNIVISALILATPESSTAQLNLIDAAIASPSVTAFLPSEYGIHYTPEVQAFHPAAEYWLDAADALRASRLNFTRVIFGWTLDHYGLPRVESSMKPFRYVLDFENRRATIPGDGSQKLSLLHSRDLGRYICAILEDGGEWPEISAFVAGVLTWNEFVEVAEKVTGEKWTITYDSVAALEKGEATMLPQPPGAPTEADYPGMRGMISEFGLMSVKGVLDVSPLGTRNAEFPHVKPMGVEEVLDMAWGKGSAGTEDSRVAGLSSVKTRSKNN